MNKALLTSLFGVLSVWAAPGCGDEPDWDVLPTAGAGGMTTSSGGTSAPVGGQGGRGGSVNGASGSESSGGAAGGMAGAPNDGGGMTSSAGAGGSDAPSVCDGATIAESDADISDFEDDISFDDHTAPYDGCAVSQASPAHAGNYALHATTPNSGGGVVHDFSGYGPNQCFDASAYEGLSFWTYFANGSDAIELQLMVPEQTPVPEGDCVADCEHYPTVLIGYVNPGVWEQHIVNWDQFQGDFPFNDKLLGLRWAHTSIDELDFYVDDLSYAEPGAGGAGG